MTTKDDLRTVRVKFATLSNVFIHIAHVCDFHSLRAVGRGSETPLQVVENVNERINYRVRVNLKTVYGI